MGSLKGSWLRTLLQAVPYLVFAALVFTIFPITTDDSYITLRYAKNLLAGHGPVFNIGERVEGYSSPLHMVLLATALKVAPGLDALFLAKLISLAFGLVVLVQLRGLAKKVGLGESGILLAQAFVALNVNFALASVNGLETTFYSSLVLAFLSRFIDECRTGRGLHSAAFAVLMLLTRPDSMLLVAAAIIVRIVLAKRQVSGVSSWGRWLGLIAAGAGALFIWRYLYYGALLPNTYYAKQVPLGGGLTLGLRYYLRGVSADTLMLSGIVTHPLKYLGVLVFWGLCFIGIARQRKEIDGLVFVALLGASLLFMLRSGGDWMLGWRFMIPMLPVIAILQSFGVQRLAERFPRVRAHGFQITALVAMLLALANAPRLSWAQVGFSTDGRALLQAHGGNEGGTNGKLWVAVGDYIRRNFPPDSRIAYSEMGYSGFTNLDKKFLDLRGLTDTAIAHSASKRRTIEGIQDDEWYLPDNPLQPRLLEFDPDAILSGTPTGRPVVLETYAFRENIAGVEVYTKVPAQPRDHR